MRILSSKSEFVNKAAHMERNDSFWRELNTGDINFRDRLQFELVSEFEIDPSNPLSTLTQEFYIFIPNSLQINSHSYPKEQFWIDETNLIRYKTPTLNFAQLINTVQTNSPLFRIENLKPYLLQKETLVTIMDELKLFANIFRNDLRRETKAIVDAIHEKKPDSEILEWINKFCGDIQSVRNKYLEIQADLKEKSADPLFKINVNHIDEFISLSIDFFLTGLADYWSKDQQELYALIQQEIEHREKNHLVPKKIKGSEEKNESVLYRLGVLDKFILEALLLNNYRQSWTEKHGDIVGAIAAGIAMTVYMILFVWKAQQIAITSTPFIIFAVVFYMLKDRIKEGLKKLYYGQAFRWFPDYATKITNQKERLVGKITESFLFIDENDLPPGFLAIRNFDFHEELQSIKRQENIIRYKKEVSVYQNPETERSRRRELNIIFRLNINRFLEKANDALQPVLSLDPVSGKIVEKLLPKVYHLNMIIKDTFTDIEGKKIVDIKKFRVVVDKNGIKRVEEL